MTETNSAGRRRRLAEERAYLRSAWIAGVGLLLITAFVFLGAGGVSRTFKLRAEVASSNQLKSGSVVRIAGVDVGKVTGVDRGPGNTSVVSMEIDDRGLPIHRDARLSILPRLVLEGSFYVRLAPGSPSAGELRSGDLIPLRQTAIPVQLDQVVRTFDLATRDGLHAMIAGIGNGLGPAPAGPTAAPSGAQSLRAAVRALNASLPSIGQAARLAQGTEAGDLARAVGSSRDFAGQIASDPAALAGIVTNFDRVAGALAAESRPLARSVRNLAQVVREAPPSLAALDVALPEVARFARDLDPALRRAPRPLRRARATVGELRRLVRPGRLPALLRDLEPLTAALPSLERELQRIAPRVTAASRCLKENVVPVLNAKLKDGAHTSGDPVWLEQLHAASAAVSIGGGFDANGNAIRIGLADGASAVSGVLPGVGDFRGILPAIQGVRPAWLGYGVEPPYRPDKWCHEQPLPDLNAPASPPPSWARKAP